MKKSVALFDLDKTIYNDHSFFGWMKFSTEKGLIGSGAWDRVMGELNKYRQKTQSYPVSAQIMLRIFADDLKGKDYGQMVDVTKDFFVHNRANFYSYFEEILPQLRKTHAIYLVTTNSQMVADVIVEMFGLDGRMCSEFEVQGGKFTGRITQSLAGGKDKVEELVGRFGGESIAVGDSENDIAMLERVKHAVCFQPSEGLLKVAKARGWGVVNGQTAGEYILNLLKSTSHVQS